MTALLDTMPEDLGFDLGPPASLSWDAAVLDRTVRQFMKFGEALVGSTLFPYQQELAYRIIEAILRGDGATITAIQSRQSGKTQTLAFCIATCMVLLPRLANAFPQLARYRDGFQVGVFAPVDSQAKTIFDRIVKFLKSPSAGELMVDPEIDDKVEGGNGALVTLAKSRSFCRMQTAHPKASIESKSYHFMLVDECFPAGTPVLTTEGWVPIEKIVNGTRRDWIAATQGADGDLEWARVRTGYRTRRRTQLVRVDHEHGSLYATANHPFMVDGQAVPAIHLRAGAPLSVVSAALEPPLALVGVQQFASSDAAERDARSGCAGEGLWHAPCDGASATYPWGQRDGADEAAGDVAGRLRRPVDPRACRPVWRTGEGRNADSLQVGPGASVAEDRGGDRRELARGTEETGSGSAQDRLVVQSRVVCVAVLEPGSAEFDQFSDGADHVYTLEVDHPSHTYVTAGVVVGNCQDADKKVVNKSIRPMGSFYNATIVYTGTATYTKGLFYDQIQRNKRKALEHGGRHDHFEFDWRQCARYNPDYAASVAKDRDEMGEDSDEFRMSYLLYWPLETGMFTTRERLAELADGKMEVLTAYFPRDRTSERLVAGLDVARKVDSTVLTVLWVDMSFQDSFGYHDHRVLNWLEIRGDRWEEQYGKIVEFLSQYGISDLAVDGQGVGDVVADRLTRMLPAIAVHELGSGMEEQSARWKHLMELVNRGLVSWPGGSKTRRTKTWQRFVQQMEDLEKDYRGNGKMLVAAAPRTAGAHDDFPDSLALACSLTKDMTMPTVQTAKNVFYAGSGRR